MTLDEYLSRPGAESATSFAGSLQINPDQVRQWRHRYEGREPIPATCVLIEEATNCMVRRWDLRPSDWHLIWPELIKAKGAPKPADQKAEGANV